MLKGRTKSRLVIEISRTVQADVGRRKGVPQPKVSAMLRGDFAYQSRDKRLNCLKRPGYDIEIKVQPATEPMEQPTQAPN